PVSRVASRQSLRLADVCAKPLSYGGQHMSRSRFCTVLMAELYVLLGIYSTEAHWVMAAKTVKNRVQQMMQTSKNEGYDVSIVALEAAPADVYNKTLKSLQSHPEITITRNDGKTGRIEIRKGKQVAGFQISPLGEKLTQFVIASSVSEAGEPSPTSSVVDAVLRVCGEGEVNGTAEPN